METRLKTAPAKAAISMDDLKKHLRIDAANMDEESILISIISEATDNVEQYLWRKLITQSWYAYFSEWPAGDYIELPFGNLQSVTTIKYTDTEAAQSTWSASEYIVGTDYQHGRISLAYGYTWPNDTLYASNPIEVDFTCGYGDSLTDIPGTIRRAIMIMAAEIYENREVTVYGQTITNNELIYNLLSPYRINQL